jgi:hypothetical protein
VLNCPTKEAVVRTCGKCGRQSQDHILACPKCGANLLTESTVAQALAKLRADERITEVRILADRNCCPTCREHARSYLKDQTPVLPIEGCSHALGCRCVYEPVLDVVGA